MLVIRREQMRAFEGARRQQFEETLLPRLYAGGRADRRWLEAQIGLGIEAGRAFGLVLEWEVASLIEITCAYIPGGFPENDPAKLPVPALAVLLTRGLDTGVKLERYRKWASEWDGEKVWR
ncbi:MAG: hypothetical protein JNK48_14225 [Bryobacterales bacterium]|nr:hypothetical protein [Bryobacterales bacterium]